MSDAIVGFFNWRRDNRGRLYPEKILREHRDIKINSANHQEGEDYRRNLVKEIPLNEAGWKLSLADCVKLHPAETFNGVK